MMLIFTAGVLPGVMKDTSKCQGMLLTNVALQQRQVIQQFDCAIPISDVYSCMCEELSSP